MGGVVAMIADNRGRNPFGWFILGAMCCYGIPAIILLYSSPNLREIEAKEIKNNEDKRRLMEQLQQTQLKLQVFQRITNERIDWGDAATVGPASLARRPAGPTCAGDLALCHR